MDLVQEQADRVIGETRRIGGDETGDARACLGIEARHPSGVRIVWDVQNRWCRPGGLNHRPRSAIPSGWESLRYRMNEWTGFKGERTVV
jgi:hypothetical protein